jgi:ubiquinone/menaquinone biosynthesis C-methylase UbiE
MHMSHVVDFYTRHPISRDHILLKLRNERGHLDDVRPEELFAHDQDHYGGLAANDALAVRAGLHPGQQIADFCAGLGGPARYFAHRYGVHVTGIELNPGRAAGAQELTRLVGLAHHVRIVEGDVTKAPLPDGSVDVVVSQEAMLHVPDKAAALREAFRILRPGGRLVFTDWVTHRPLAPADADAMWQGIAAQTLQGLSDYRRLLDQAGFSMLSVEDMTDEWAVILRERFAMYRRLREETARESLAAGDEAFYRAYARLVALVEERTLGGARFAAERRQR